MYTKKYLPILGVALLPAAAAIGQTGPNFVIMMTDQQRADLCGREGFPMEVTPFADRMAAEGVWFDRAYTTAPASVPARTSFLTGRWPKATRVNSNHNEADVVYGEHMFGVARRNGYKTAMVGKNHSFLRPADADFWTGYGHGGKDGRDGKSEQVAEFDRYLGSTDLYADMDPAPFDTSMQQPARMVDEALEWIAGIGTDPFLMWLSFPEPHNPYQVGEPYYSIFAPDRIPRANTGPDMLPVKGEKYETLAAMMGVGHMNYEQNLERLRGNYLGMIRLIDDQMARFVEQFRSTGLYENTVFIILSDHGDYAGEYGLMKKGAGLSDALARIPMVWFGGGIPATGLATAHMSIADIMPTVCEMMGDEIPVGVQGRSLTEVLYGRPYPRDEFRSVMVENGYGGQYYTREDGTDYRAEGAVHDKPYFFDELNTWSQSGSSRALRMGDWKLEYDMMGTGEMYDLSTDPSEINNLYDDPAHAGIRNTLLAELLKWDIATVDPLPVPRRRYIFKRNPHNYMFTDK